MYYLGVISGFYYLYSNIINKFIIKYKFIIYFKYGS
uniref:Uncharacterized protein n=1 Tax=Dasyclonium flaccidum TaxID=2007274 RepID=A0A1Z1ML68_9FLOR|nr:hypothetical protein [Dasyclonium flaccidum]ARW66535.1 hypothetical protein [Dasyclonium flaccidum]